MNQLYTIKIPEKIKIVLDNLPKNTSFKLEDGREIFQTDYLNMLRYRKEVNEIEYKEYTKQTFPKEWFIKKKDENIKIKEFIEQIFKDRPFENNILIYIDNELKYIIKNKINFLNSKDYKEDFYLISKNSEESINNDPKLFLFDLIKRGWNISEIKYEKYVSSYIEKIKKYYIYNTDLINGKRKSKAGEITTWLNKEEFKKKKESLLN